ncbi:hypothetical protein QEH56_08740 [Pelagicoccus enzymogenes]|uniref:hypothetical protein n=1 Tax=Pelagicoccus enzymogenes TaxID=2773457 RepID=UPI00280FA752|nr:hypothetical protein [Pelagicoccus enzymogenes]MDQ8198230.1 hypothetical protein [Pelagicoccus enzymogenes]
MKPRTFYTSVAKPLTAILILFATYSIADARPEKTSPTVEINDKGQVVHVQWAKAFVKKDNTWIRMRLSKSRFANLSPSSHIHMEIYDANSTLLKHGYQEISSKAFFRGTAGHLRQQTVHYDTELNKDIDISRIEIRTCQQKHDNDNNR